MKTDKKVLLIVLLFSLLLPSVFFSQSGSTETDDLMDLEVDLDDLFADEPEEADSPLEEEAAEPVEEKIDLLNDVIGKSDFSLEGSFKFITGYSTGFSYMPWESRVGDGREDMEDMALLDMSSSLKLNFQISPEFRVLQTYSFSFPEFETTVSEFFGDYSLKDRAFFRIGRQNLTWGNSRYFPFANLTARVPDDFEGVVSDDISDADSYALKMDIPVAIGGIQAIAFTRNGFFEDPDAPSSDEIGYGGTLNLAGTWGDLTLGTFYHKAMNWRGFYSFSKTLLGNLEMYQEGVISYDEQNDDIAPDNINDFSEVDQIYKYPVAEGEYPFEEILSDRWDIDLNIGFYWELLDKKLKLSGEYFYCGEETELDLKNSSYPLMWGHNLAGGISCKICYDKVNLFGQFRYNRKEKSGVLIPGVTWEAAPHMTLNFVMPIIFGDTEGGYYKENADELDRPVSFSLFCIISGKMTD